MNEEKHEWIEEVFNSMKDHVKATPNDRVLTKIKEHISDKKHKIMPLQLWRSVAAAAIAIVLINTLAILSYTKELSTTKEDFASVESVYEPLISSYQMYE